MRDAAIQCLDPVDRAAKLAAEFEKIWDIYPKRVAKADGLEHYNARRKEGVRFRVLFAAAKAYKEERRGEDAKFTMQAKTFFGTKHRYLDYDGKANGSPERKDGKWAPPMTRDLQAMAKRDEEEEEARQQTQEEPTTDPSPTMESAEERLKNL